MVSPDVFRVVNNRPLGDVAQSITMINGKYFIALNNSKKIEIVNSKTFESEGTILYTQAGLPRQIVAISDTTAIVSDLLSNNVSGVDLPSQLVRIRTVPPYGTPLEYIVIKKVGEYSRSADHKLFGITAKRGLCVRPGQYYSSCKLKRRPLLKSLAGSVGATYTTQGQIVAINGRSFLIQDNSGKILVYLGWKDNKPVVDYSATIGQTVK